MRKPILIVQGGQYGSEAKGAIAGRLCTLRDVDLAVRTGATNAGHTVYYNGTPVKLQQLPVGFVNPKTKLIVGAGALIDPEILDREVKLLSELTGADIRDRLYVDSRAGLHLSTHAMRSAESGRHHAIGATGKGCSEALVDRIRGRGRGYQRFGETGFAKNYDCCDTERLLNYGYDEGAQILLEGTQGQLLDLYTGPYPYTTHKQTGPAQWMLECGLSPALKTEIVLVVRTMPIRVAGNSGPMPNETSWPILARSLNRKRDAYGLPPLVSDYALGAFDEALKIAARQYHTPEGSDGSDQHFWLHRDKYTEALSELNRTAWGLLAPEVQEDLSRLFEMTTVTRKLRRIAKMSITELQTAARQTRPHWAALTFCNYWWPQHWYQLPKNHDLFTDGHVVTVEQACAAPVHWMTFGPDPAHIQSRHGDC